MSVDLVVAIPMLGRPHRVVTVLESIRTSCDARVVFATTPGDREVEAAVDAAGCERVSVARQRLGDWARKVNAVYRFTTEGLIFTGADDLLFHPGWLDAARAQLAPGVGVVGTNDLGSPRVMKGLHATHMLVTRAYADEFGTVDGPGAVAPECYPHEFTDDEMVATAKARGAWAFAADALVEHLHPNWGKGPMDSLYAQQAARMRLGRSTFERRRRLWT